MLYAVHGTLTCDFGAYDKWHGDVVREVLEVTHVARLPLLQEADLVALLVQGFALLGKEGWRAAENTNNNTDLIDRNTINTQNPQKPPIRKLKSVSE